ncbi:MAG: ATP-grasp domain-containing protein [Clostridia bacterium]|nr:ATP-grasp domain-containing protein [Clostridia bacterium]
MSEKQNVLVFSGATYPAMQVIDCLKNHPRFHVIAAASYPNHSEYVCADTITDLPFIHDERFLEAFKELLVTRRIAFVIPTDETIALVLKQHEAELPAVVVCSPFETTVLCRHKQQMYEALAGEEFLPRVYSAAAIDEITDYPLFIKPDEGQGAKGSRLITHRAELDTVENLADMVIAEYLPGDEYTVDCFTTKEGRLIFCNPRVRTRLMNGITARGHNIPCTAEFRTIIERLNERLAFRGYWYVQLRRDRQGRLKLLEICTRFAGSFAISKGKGVNLPLLALCDFSGLDTNLTENDYVVECDKTYIDRYRLHFDYTHLYVDYDDTVTCNQGQAVNPYVIAYLYQCKAKGVRVTLLTRHAASFGEPLAESLRRLHIAPDLFDEIVELDWDTPKHTHIRDPKTSIFLDNSFAERKSVQDRHHMPVFDVCNVDSLFDWRA